MGTAAHQSVPADTASALSQPMLSWAEVAAVNRPLRARALAASAAPCGRERATARLPLADSPPRARTQPPPAGAWRIVARGRSAAPPPQLTAELPLTNRFEALAPSPPPQSAPRPELEEEAPREGDTINNPVVAVEGGGNLVQKPQSLPPSRQVVKRKKKRRKQPRVDSEEEVLDVACQAAALEAQQLLQQGSALVPGLLAALRATGAPCPRGHLLYAAPVGMSWPCSVCAADLVGKAAALCNGCRVALCHRCVASYGDGPPQRPRDSVG